MAPLPQLAVMHSLLACCFGNAVQSTIPSIVGFDELTNFGAYVMEGHKGWFDMPKMAQLRNQAARGDLLPRSNWVGHFASQQHGHRISQISNKGEQGSNGQRRCEGSPPTFSKSFRSRRSHTTSPESLLLSPKESKV